MAFADYRLSGHIDTNHKKWLLLKCRYAAETKSAADKVLTILLILPIIFATLAVHELGHLITGMLQGFKFQLFVVGPFGVKRKEDRINSYFNTNLAHYGGIAATSPADDHPDNAKKFGRIILAGPIASLLFAIICLTAASQAYGDLGFMFFTGGILSIGIFYATTIPSQTGMFFTDRKRYQRLITPGPDQDIEMAILRMPGKYSQENSYSNVSKADLQIMIEDPTPFIKFFGLFNLLCYEIEVEQNINPETQTQYDDFCKTMSKSMVSAFNKEIDNQKIKHLQNQ